MDGMGEASEAQAGSCVRLESHQAKRGATLDAHSGQPKCSGAGSSAKRRQEAVCVWSHSERSELGLQTHTAYGRSVAVLDHM